MEISDNSEIEAISGGIGSLEDGVRWWIIPTSDQCPEPAENEGNERSQR